jgi:hypothetical protein
MNQKTWAAALVTLALGVLAFGCQSGGIGDPCTPEDEYQQFFSGYEVTEVNIESKSFQCETRLCLVNHFNGRVSCPYGQTDVEAKQGMVPADQEAQLCHIPGTSSFDTRIKVAVNKQFTGRKAADSVYCSCRCGGADSNARYCKCPTGFQCAKLLEPIDRLGSKELAGSYCIKNGTEYSAASPNTGLPCTITKPGAMPPEAPGDCGLYNGQ